MHIVLNLCAFCKKNVSIAFWISINLNKRKHDGFSQERKYNENAVDVNKLL